MNWNHYINGTEVFPKGTRSSEIQKIKEKFRKRVKCPQSIKLIGNDYFFAKTLEIIDNKHKYEILRNGQVESTGEFVKNDMTFDDTKESCIINLNAYDEYTIINEM